MSDLFMIIFLYVVGSAVLIAELFLPAHGLIGVVGLCILGYGIYYTYTINETAGVLSTVVLAVLLPTALVYAVRNWHRTPIGRRISPPNPKLTSEDRMPVEQLKPLIGQVGRSLTPLRPVGTCEFDGRRVECVAEYGMIPKGVEVEAVRLIDRSVAVRAVSQAEGSVAG